MRIELLPVARRDTYTAARYYNRKSPGLGDRMLDEVGVAIRKILENPTRLQPISRPLWRRRLHRFQYGIL